MSKGYWVCLAAGIAGLGLLAAEAAEQSPRKGVGHGECISEVCDGQGRTQARERQRLRRGEVDGESEGRQRERIRDRKREGRGEGRGQGELRQDQGQGRGWRRDGKGTRKGASEVSDHGKSDVRQGGNRARGQRSRL